MLKMISSNYLTSRVPEAMILVGETGSGPKTLREKSRE